VVKDFPLQSCFERVKKIILNKEGDELDWAKSEWEILNDLACEELMIACQDDMCFGIIDGSRHTIFPDGDASLAWKRLNEKFEPRNSSNIMTIKRDFIQCSLKKERDPEDWINQLLLMNRRLEGMGYKMSEMEIIVHIHPEQPTPRV
jgi:hypothetical protein